jgi:fused signal recognition particle receptor
LDNVIHGKAKVGPELLEELEEVLLRSDVGVNASMAILDELRAEAVKEHLRTNAEIVGHLKRILSKTLEDTERDWVDPGKDPLVILMVGINGSGKTTTIGKLAGKWKEEGKKVLLAAGDTFRAAAGEQLTIWAERAGVSIVCQKTGTDPSAVAFDAVKAAVARKMDVVLIDTAGRLQTNHNLMEELKKIKRVIGKALPNAPHEILLVLDSGLGQNANSQCKQFDEALSVSGLIMTKLDGTGKGGVLFNLAKETKKPVRYIGVGEKYEDLQEFNSKAFVDALFES